MIKNLKIIIKIKLKYGVVGDGDSVSEMIIKFFQFFGLQLLLYLFEGET